MTPAGKYIWFSSNLKTSKKYNARISQSAIYFISALYLLQIILHLELQVLQTFSFLNPLLLPTDAHNVKKRRVIKTF